MELKDAVALYQTQVQVTNELWTFFGTVTLAVLGFTIGSDNATSSGWSIATIVCGYAAFALCGNLPALVVAYTQLSQFSALVARASCDSSPLELKVYSVRAVAGFHIGVVVLVSLAIIVYWLNAHRATAAAF